MTIPDVQDCRHQSPVFFGYDLARKPTGRGGDIAEDDEPQREDFVAHREGKPCPVCLVGKPGAAIHEQCHVFVAVDLFVSHICPVCFEFDKIW